MVAVCVAYFSRRKSNGASWNNPDLTANFIFTKCITTQRCRVHKKTSKSNCLSTLRFSFSLFGISKDDGSDTSSARVDVGQNETLHVVLKRRRIEILRACSRQMWNNVINFVEDLSFHFHPFFSFIRCVWLISLAVYRHIWLELGLHARLVMTRQLLAIGHWLKMTSSTW